ncbi:MAG TPA: ABC transporter permease, partial [Gemmatimonadaceae bacterium]|nr:ABC transporter permease [Gemmatimonadaceae bacterium]
AVVTGVVFGLVPAAALTESQLGETLKEGARGSSGGRGAQRARVALVVGQTAVALVLLAGAGLLVRSLARVNAFDPGFRAEELVVARIAVPEQKYSAVRAVETGLAIAEQLRATPGVRGAALASDTPMDGGSSATLVKIEGRSDATQEGAIRIYRHRVSPGFFAALGTPIVSGRDFTDRDADTARAGPGVVVISQAMAKRYWPNGDALGKRLLLGTTPAEIVGVAGDVKYRTLLEAATADPDVYFPIRAVPSHRYGLVVRAAGAPEGIVAAVRREVAAADRDIPVFSVATMRERLRGQTAQSRFNTALLSGFAALALVLAAVGLYGVMAYSVGQRTHEIGIRMALGAARGDVLRLVVWQGARVALAGVAIGVAAALAVTRVLRDLLVGVEPTDPATFGAVAGMLTAVALVAAYVPARRAARVDPVRALRSE